MTIFKHWLFNFHLIFCISFFSLNGVGNIKISNITLDSSSSFITVLFFFSCPFSFNGHCSVIVERMVAKIRWKNNLIWKVNHKSRLKRENITCNYPLTTQWKAKRQPRTRDRIKVISWQVVNVSENVTMVTQRALHHVKTQTQVK